MENLVKILTPGVSSQYVRYGKDSFYEFLFDLDSGTFVYQFISSEMTYLDIEDGLWHGMESDCYGVYDISQLKTEMEWIYDNQEMKYKFRCAAFDFVFYFKNEDDMLLFKTKILKVVYPEIMEDKKKAKFLGFI